MQISLCHS